MYILGIETSCDETGVAICHDQQGLLAHKIYSQVTLHADYGGVVPELASRNHLHQIIPLIQMVLAQAGLKAVNIDGIAYTAGPGLMNALMVGATVGSALAYALRIPAIAVHHMEAHLLTPMLEENPPTFPFIGLLVSGGHTQLIAVTGIGKYRLLGESIDDAVGEVFDKVAGLLGIDYPGGSALSKLAQKGVARRYIFPRPMTNRPGLDFSFSGLKTFAENTIRANIHATNSDDENRQIRADIARAFEDAVVDTMVIKCRRALDYTGFQRLVVAGGVSANKNMRKNISALMHHRRGQVFYARPEFCTDNGAMIAYTGLLRFQLGRNNNDLTISVRPRWPLEELSTID